jgi:hypothetical protein
MVVARRTTPKKTTSQNSLWAEFSSKPASQAAGARATGPEQEVSEAGLAEETFSTIVEKDEMAGMMLVD